jgi:hypothetical protein
MQITFKEEKQTHALRYVFSAFALIQAAAPRKMADARPCPALISGSRPNAATPCRQQS